ncbi:hypothetical protein [Myroides indicus]|uniref:Uncharacterized protein n=1 Tax=Myroides indicus TaxID=1323422 RepID=A0A4R7EPN8_9FLAO|nr:hypothetical protein [Myroides indicus]TDS53971.1 hypothetical protein C8P70_1263 [Myroides indicus]
MLYTRLLNQFKEGYLGYGTLGLLLQSCVGGVTAMFILKQGGGDIQKIELFLTTALCMTYNASFFANFNKKFIFNLLLFSIGINCLLIIFSSLI